MTKQFCDCCGVEMKDAAVYGGMGSSKKPMKVIVKEFKGGDFERETVYCISCSEPIRKMLEGKS